MDVKIKNIESAIESQKESINEMIERKGADCYPSDLTPVIFIYHKTTRTASVGWNFQPTQIEVGDIIPYDTGCVSSESAIIAFVYGK